MKKRIITGSLIFLVTAIIVALTEITEMPYFFTLFILFVNIFAVKELIKVYNSQNKKCSNAYVYLSYLYVFVVYQIYFVVELLKRSSTYIPVKSILVFQLVVFFVFFILAFIFDLLFLAKQRKKIEKNTISKEETSNEAYVKVDESIEEERDVDASELLLTTKRTLSLMIYPTTLLATFYGIANILTINVAFIILIFGVTYCTDVFAYFVGTLFHKGEFAPQISPKKSVSGAIGGILGGIIFSLIAYILLYHYNIFRIEFLISMTPLRAKVFFGLVGLFGSLLVEFGDLVASTIKRQNGVKDFGNMFPGHGGMMDRVDGLMFCSAFTYVLVLLLFA